MRRDQLIVALDVENFKQAKRVVHKLGTSVSFYKIGLRLFTKEGPKIVRWLKQKKQKIFLDLKLHDIPNTVAQAVESLADLEVDFITIHASGGGEMMKAAVKAAHQSALRLKKKRLHILAVTVLTSLNNLKPLGISAPISRHVLRLTKLAAEAGVDGVVCSPLEIKTIRKEFGHSFKIVTPGIRLPDANSKDDQKRVATPKSALADGANYLVVGRPILESSSPKETVRRIFKTSQMKAD